MSSAFKVVRKKSIKQILAIIVIYSLPITWFYLLVEKFIDLSTFIIGGIFNEIK